MKYEECDLNEKFLQPLKNIPDAPEHLWRQGKIPRKTKQQKVVAIVGARRCTKYGEEIAYRLAFDLAKLGVFIVSGLAYGIDTCAHRGCLDGGGTTVAVLGTPINKIHPRSNYGLAQRILEKGAIISEYPVDYETHA
ncbi:DNA-processing protein DprA [Candidatus Saccharibacteria bacterium]|nr:DNA-processing protein DprA [Candidatus Saccharibacteria bacterium]